MKRITENLDVWMFAKDSNSTIMTVSEQRNYETGNLEIIATYGPEAMPPTTTEILTLDNLKEKCREHKSDLRKWRSCEVANA